MANKNNVELSDNIYWIGEKKQFSGLHCNPYLIVDGDEAVLVDPGSVLDFEYVYKNLCEIIPLEKVKYVILQHQDPDLCSSVPLFEAKGANFKIVTHWRTKTIVKFYGIKSEYYIINNNKFSLELKSGRKLDFIQTPYLHFAGSIVTYDTKSKILFSSDLFGAFSKNREIFASDDYIERMKAFHEHYMPANDILRPIMEVFLGMDISIIAPQHGCIIKENNVNKFIKILRDLECGSFLAPIKRNLKKSGGYKILFFEVFKRYESIFTKKEVLEVIKDLDIKVDENFNILDYNCEGDALWELIFDKVFLEKGIEWLLIIEPFVQKLAVEYDVKMPKIFDTNLKKAEEASINLIKENADLKDINKKLEESIKETNEKLVKDSVTGLYNYNFFKAYMINEIEHFKNGDYKQLPELLIISIDNWDDIIYANGENDVENIYKNIVYIMESLIEDQEIYFDLKGALFACYMPFSSKDQANRYAEKIRNEIFESNTFIAKMSVSIGVASFDEINNELNKEDAFNNFYNLAMTRIKIAKNKGMNFVCSKSAVIEVENLTNILLIDSDKVNIDVLKTVLENINFNVMVATDGDMALKFVDENKVDLIISAIMIPKSDGFLIREKLLSKSYTKNIPFIIVSYVKNEATVQRAFNLGIKYYLKKPYLLNELTGVVNEMTQRGGINE
jgi:diguanylate cyclase (GGDEF)-like protein